MPYRDDHESIRARLEQCERELSILRIPYPWPRYSRPFNIFVKVAELCLVGFIALLLGSGLLSVLVLTLSTSKPATPTATPWIDTCDSVCKNRNLEAISTRIYESPSAKSLTVYCDCRDSNPDPTPPMKLGEVDLDLSKELLNQAVW